jgi:hypothetical protein
MTKEYTSESEPLICPECGSERIATYLYGKVFDDPELSKDIKDGKIVLGGCILMRVNPKWQCTDCLIKIYDY